MTPQYRAWLIIEGTLIKADGCSHAFEWAHCCCLEHDLAYYYGRDPQHAFQIGGPTQWQLADPIGFMTANSRFRAHLPWYLKYRWLAVSTAGWPIWTKHRSLRP